MIALLLYTALAAAAPEQGTAIDSIVVTGKRLKASEDALKACLARHCPPDDDIDATLELAESQLMAGEYRHARTTLLRSISRNKDEAARYPIPVSDLYRANGRVAANLGLDRSYYNSTVNILRALKEGIPEKDYRYFSARMEIAAMMARLKGHERARIAYAAVADDARKAGRRDIAAMAELKSAASHLPPGDLQESRIRRISLSQDPEERTAMLQAKLLLAQYAYRDKDNAKFDRIMKEFAGLRLTRPLLIYSPPYALAAKEVDQGTGQAGTLSAADPAASPFQGRGSMPSAAVVPGQPSERGNRFPTAGFSTTRRLTGNFEDRWIDVSFRVQPNGRVADVQLVRSDGDIFWAKPLLETIKERIYAPVAPDSPASVRKERYTYTAGYERLATGTRTAQRAPRPRVEFIDLTPDADNALRQEGLQ